MNGGLCFLISWDSRINASISESVFRQLTRAAEVIILEILGLVSPDLKYEDTRFLRLAALPIYKIGPRLLWKKYTPGVLGTVFLFKVFAFILLDILVVFLLFFKC